MSDTSNEQQLTGNNLLAARQRVLVSDNGSCWLSSPLACLSELDHAHICSEEVASSEPKRKKRKGQKKAKKKAPADNDIGEPSDRDRNLDKVIRQHLFDNHRGLLGEDAELVLICPSEGYQGTYGGQEHFAALAAAFKVDIVLYEDNEEGRRTPSKEWELFTAGSGVSEFLTANEIQERMNDQERQRVPVLHVAAARDIPNHFEAYRCKEGHPSYELPSWFREANDRYNELKEIIDSAEQ